MAPSIRRTAALGVLFLLSTFALAQSDSEDGGYIGYRLNHHGDPDSVTYETANTAQADDPTEVEPLDETPDVYLNASVSVGTISVEVDNITAKVNLDARVLKLLHFNAGVDASIDRVRLLIENVSAKVELEARLGNVVRMVDDVLRSIDLNPIIATLGQEVAEIVNGTVDTITDPVEGLQKRDLNYNIEHNVLYSVNDYTGHTHTNRVLAQDGSIYDEFLDNDGTETGREVVGSYKTHMKFTGHNRTVTDDEGTVREVELEYEYAPFPGLEVTSWVYQDAEGNVVRTQVVAEVEGGGTSTISNDSDDI